MHSVKTTCTIMTNQAYQCLVAEIDVPENKTTWDGYIKQKNLRSRLRRIQKEGHINAWLAIHAIEDMIPCDHCKAKRLTQGLHQAVSYNVVEDTADIPPQYDNALRNLKILTDRAFARAVLAGRLSRV